MKNIFKLIIVTFICFFFCVSVNASEDIHPPVLNGITNAKNNLSSNDKLYINMSITEEESGIDYGIVGLYSYEENKIKYQLEIKDINNVSYVIIPNNVVDGDYLIAYVILYDKKGNGKTYYNEELKKTNISTDLIESSSFMRFQTTNVTLSKKQNDNNDSFIPSIKNIELSSNEINFGDSISFSVYFDGETKFDNVYGLFERLSSKGSINQYFNYNSSRNVYETSFIPNKDGEYRLAELHLFDENNNYYIFYYDSNVIDKTFVIDKEYKFSVKGNSKNNMSLIVDYKFNKSKVNIGERIKYYLETREDEEFENISATFINKSEDKNEITCDLKYNEEIKKYECEINVDESFKEEIYYLEYLVFEDKNGNYYNYSTSLVEDGVVRGKGGTTLKIRDLFFEVVSPKKYDLVLSNIDNDVYDKIVQSEHDVSIYIDANSNPIIDKKIFEYIMNSDRVLCIKYNDFEWVFNGKDITKPKQINVSAISGLLQSSVINNSSNDYVSITFKNNKELPGQTKIRIRLEDTFKYEEGLNDLVLYYESDENLKAIKNNAEYESSTVYLSEDGYYEFIITHNSSYILTNKEINFIKEKISVTNTINLNNNLVWIILGCAFGVFLLIAFISSSNKKNNKEDLNK